MDSVLFVNPISLSVVQGILVKQITTYPLVTTGRNLTSILTIRSSKRQQTSQSIERINFYRFAASISFVVAINVNTFSTVQYYKFSICKSLSKWQQGVTQ